MTVPARADLLALLNDVEAYLAKHVDVVDVEGGDGEGPQPVGPNDAARLLVSVTEAIAELERAQDESALPPIVCTGSSWPPACLAYDYAGTGTCGICGGQVGVGPLGVCATHPYPVPAGGAVVQPERLTEALIRWLDENVRKCDHGYVSVTCAPCMANWLPR